MAKTKTDDSIVTIRLEGEALVYLAGRKTGTHSIAVDAGDVIENYHPTGAVDGETVYRLVDRERK